jgi:hypothetical protein
LIIVSVFLKWQLGIISSLEPFKSASGRYALREGAHNINDGSHGLHNLAKDPESPI